MLYHKPRLLWSKTLSTKIKTASKPKKSKKKIDLRSSNLAKNIIDILEQQSAEEIVKLDLRGKSSIADFMIIASGRSNRHVGALTDYVKRGLKEAGEQKLGIEGLEQCDWVLIDAGDVILHIFRPEVREYYALEKLWALPTLHNDLPAT